MKRLIELISRGVTNSVYHMLNVELVEHKLATLISGGVKNLQVITDFDRTLSKYSHNGVMNPTCHGIFESGTEITPAIKTKLINLSKQYHPIEVNEHMDIKDKIPHMLEWWKQSHDIILDAKIHYPQFVKTVENSGLLLRDYVPEFLKKLDHSKVPILIFSAGIGNVIESLLVHFNLYFENITIVSNMLKFNEAGLLTDFSEPIIHTYNKTVFNVLHNTTLSAVLRAKHSHRRGILLLGDSTGDVHMADGIVELVDAEQHQLAEVATVGIVVEGFGDVHETMSANKNKKIHLVDSVASHQQQQQQQQFVQSSSIGLPITRLDGMPKCSSNNTVFKIGYLNNSIDSMLQNYMSLYDIVIIKEDTFNLPLSIINEILLNDIK